MNILFCLILWTNISHSITTSIPRILQKLSPHINVRRSSKPLPCYHNFSATMQLLLSDDIQSNPGQVNPTESSKNRKQKPQANLLETNRNHLSIAHLNRQSMSSTFDEFQVMLCQHPFDIITLSKTWLRNDKNLLQNVQIPGYSFYYKNRDERLGGGVGIYIKDAIKYKEQQDLSKLDETIEHMWTECQGKNKNKNYLAGVFYQLRPDYKEKLI